MYTGAHVHEGGRSHFESFQRYLDLVRTADISIEDAAPDLKMNRKFMEEVVKANPAQVAFVHPRLCGDRAFMRMAVQEWRGAFRYAGRKLRRDRELVIDALKGRAYSSLYYPTYTDQKDIMELIAYELRDDHEFIVRACDLAGLGGDGMMQMASSRLRGDPVFVWQAFDIGFFQLSSLSLVSEELRGDRSFMMNVIKSKSAELVVQYLSAQLKQDRGFILELLESYYSPKVLKHASVQLQGDREIVMKAVEKDGEALQYASAELKGDREIVLEAVAQHAEALEDASKALRGGGFKEYLDDLMNNRFNVLPDTFLSTILFGAWRSSAAPIDVVKVDSGSTPSPSRPRVGNDHDCRLYLLQPSTMLPRPLSVLIKRLIWDFAGIRSGSKWQSIEAAEENLHCLGCDICGEIVVGRDRKFCGAGGEERWCKDCFECYCDGYSDGDY